MNAIDRIKAKLTSAEIDSLPDSAFAFVEDGGKKDDAGLTVPRSLRHYPVHDKAHVRNALARAAAQMKAGGMGAKIASHAMPKIRAAAKRMGIGVPAKEGKSSSFAVFKSIDGSYRWLGRVTNKWEDRDGEIVTDAAHREFAAWLDAHPAEAPQWWSWHTPVRKSRADWWDYADGFLVMSGPATEAEYKSYAALSEPSGMSHGFYGRRDPANPKHITKYRMFEISDLPLKVAANVWTDFQTIRKELTMAFSVEKRAYLVGVLGEEAVKEIESQTGEMAKALDAAGVSWKETDEPKAAPAQSQPDEHILKAVLDSLNLPELQTGLAAMKAQADLVPELQAQVKALTASVAALAKTDDEKIAEVIAPRVKPVEWFRASQAKETQLSDDEKDKKLKTVAPEYEWLENAMAGLIPS